MVEKTMSTLDLAADLASQQRQDGITDPSSSSSDGKSSRDQTRDERKEPASDQDSKEEKKKKKAEEDDAAQEKLVMEIMAAAKAECSRSKSLEKKEEKKEKKKKKEKRNDENKSRTVPSEEKRAEQRDGSSSGGGGTGCSDRSNPQEPACEEATTVDSVRTGARDESRDDSERETTKKEARQRNTERRDDSRSEVRRRRRRRRDEVGSDADLEELNGSVSEMKERLLLAMRQKADAEERSRTIAAERDEAFKLADRSEMDFALMEAELAMAFEKFASFLFGNDDGDGAGNNNGGGARFTAVTKRATASVRRRRERALDGAMRGCALTAATEGTRRAIAEERGEAEARVEELRRCINSQAEQLRRLKGEISVQTKEMRRLDASRRKKERDAARLCSRERKKKDEAEAMWMSERRKNGEAMGRLREVKRLAEEEFDEQNKKYKKLEARLRSESRKNGDLQSQIAASDAKIEKLIHLESRFIRESETNGNDDLRSRIAAEDDDDAQGEKLRKLEAALEVERQKNEDLKSRLANGVSTAQNEDNVKNCSIVDGVPAAPGGEISTEEEEEEPPGGCGAISCLALHGACDASLYTEEEMERNLPTGARSKAGSQKGGDRFDTTTRIISTSNTREGGGVLKELKAQLDRERRTNDDLKSQIAASVAQSRRLKELEASLKSESRRNDALESRIAEITKAMDDCDLSEAQQLGFCGWLCGGCDLMSCAEPSIVRSTKARSAGHSSNGNSSYDCDSYETERTSIPFVEVILKGPPVRSRKAGGSARALSPEPPRLI